MKGGVVRTFSQSVLTKRIAQAHNLKLYDTPILATSEFVFIVNQQQLIALKRTDGTVGWQDTLADKLSDKIQVIIAPPSAGGFFAGGLIGQRMDQARAEAQPKQAAAKAQPVSDEGE